MRDQILTAGKAIRLGKRTISAALLNQSTPVSLALYYDIGSTRTVAP
jgi:hypothetical protein